MSLHHYQPPQPHLWQGRTVDPALGLQYWYQAIELVQYADVASTAARVALIGYASDAGVRRNQGRPGAAAGPQAIRQRLARLAWHHRAHCVIDLGDVVALNDELEACQADFAAVVHAARQRDVVTIGLGGGHDIAYAHCAGLLRSAGERSLGIINFDAHFDLRPVVERANSGTPFAQLMEEYGAQVGYLAVGIQPTANPRPLFEAAAHYGVQHILATDCRAQQREAALARIGEFAQRYDWLYVSIDLDGFAAAWAPGVSAPSPLGLSPWFVLDALTQLTALQKIVGCDVAELNPTYDQQDITASLAARLIDHLVGQVTAAATPRPA